MKIFAGEAFSDRHRTMTRVTFELVASHSAYCWRKIPSQKSINRAENQFATSWSDRNLGKLSANVFLDTVALLVRLPRDCQQKQPENPRVIRKLPFSLCCGRLSHFSNIFRSKTSNLNFSRDLIRVSARLCSQSTLNIMTKTSSWKIWFGNKLRYCFRFDFVLWRLKLRRLQKNPF